MLDKPIPIILRRSAKGRASKDDGPSVTRGHPSRAVLRPATSG
jgi:hypothetical protein